MIKNELDNTFNYLKQTKGLPNNITFILVNSSKLKFEEKHRQQLLNIPQETKQFLKLLNNNYYYGTLKNGIPYDESCIFVYSDGTYYEGNCVNGNFQGKGSLIKRNGKDIKFSYEGQWKNGKPDGLGKEIIPGSMTYTGRFQKGMKHGHGLMQYQEKSEFQGEFFQNKIQGKGIYRTSAHQWSGNWQDGYLEGNGEQISYDMEEKSESKYRGNFHRGQKEGEGVYLWGVKKSEDQVSQYNGKFKNGQMDGIGRFRLGDSQFEGIWSKGVDIALHQVGRPAISAHSKIVLKRIRQGGMANK